MKLTALSIYVILARCAAASQMLTGQWTCVDSGAYELCQNLWGEDNGTGSQNATLYSASGDSISWSTTYTWSGGQYDVKSYSSVNQLSANGMLLSDITSAPTSWDWEYQEISSDLVADVSYDIWVGTTPDDPGSNTTTFEMWVIVLTPHVKAILASSRLTEYQNDLGFYRRRCRSIGLASRFGHLGRRLHLEPIRGPEYLLGDHFVRHYRREPQQL